MTTKAISKRTWQGRTPIEITPELTKRVVLATREGAYAYVAAGAAGVSSTTYKRWLKIGAAETCPADVDKAKYEQCRAFRAAVLSAQAFARQRFEQMVAKTNPLVWLRNGPGRHTEEPDDEKWTDDTVKHELSGPARGPIKFTFDIVRATGGTPEPRVIELEEVQDAPQLAPGAAFIQAAGSDKA